MSNSEQSKDKRSPDLWGPLEALKELSKERLGELKVLGEKLFEHMPPNELATMLFPPALGLDFLAGALSGEQVDDGFDPELPDQELMKASLNLARWFSEHYFSTKISGVENVPTEGAALIAGNHSAGLMPVDALFATNKIQDAQSPSRTVHPLVHDFAYVAPKIAKNARRMGILRANRENALAALGAGRLVLVYPGGDQDAFRTFKDRGKIVLAGRKGFVKTSMMAGVPIVPLVSVGLHESFIVLSKGQRLAEKLGLKKLLRTEVLPLSLSFPWGLVPAFFPFLPLPTAVEMQFCEPILVKGSPEDDDAVEAGYLAVESSMQTAMDELSKNRKPLVGR